MDIAFTSLFYRSYNALTESQKEQINQAITRYCERPDPPYPSGWRVQKLHGVKGTTLDGEQSPDIWEMHAPGPNALVVTFQRDSEGNIMFRNCGLHDKTLRSP